MMAAVSSRARGTHDKLDRLLLKFGREVDVFRRQPNARLRNADDPQAQSGRQLLSDVLMRHQNLCLAMIEPEADRVGTEAGEYRHIDRAELQRPDDGDDHFGPSRHQARDAIARFDPQALQKICKPIARFRQFPVSQAAFTAVRPDTDQRDTPAPRMAIDDGGPERHLFVRSPPQRLMHRRPIECLNRVRVAFRRHPVASKPWAEDLRSSK